jgi:ferredoxin, 2Fe-2S
MRLRPSDGAYPLFTKQSYAKLPPTMPNITIRPLDVVIEVPHGATIMTAAQEQGYYWPTTCGGEGRCTTCACLVLSGIENLSPRGRSESKVLADERGRKVLERPIRLACQAQAYGDVVLEKPGVRPPAGLRASLGAGETAG